MENIFCDVCSTRPSATINVFYITSCSHTLCGKCENGVSTHCIHCKQACKIMQISQNMPLEVKSMFMDTGKESLEIIKTLSFQNQNLKVFINQYLPLLEGKYKLLKESYMKQDAELKEFQAANRALTEENDSLKRKLWSLMPSSRGNGMTPPATVGRPPSTPILCRSDESALNTPDYRSPPNYHVSYHRPSQLNSYAMTETGESRYMSSSCNHVSSNEIGQPGLPLSRSSSHVNVNRIPFSRPSFKF